MSSKAPKICLIACTSALSPQSQRLEDLEAYVAGLDIVAQVTPVVIDDQAGSGKFAAFLEVAKALHERWRLFDGFVVLHRLDTALYAANATAFALIPNNKTIVFTGSVTSNTLDVNDLTIRANIINAVHVATQPLADVCLMFGNRLVRATQAEWSREQTHNVFDAVPGGVLGRVDFSVRLNEQALRTASKTANPELALTRVPAIAIVQINPLLDVAAFIKQHGTVEALIFYTNDRVVFSVDDMAALKNANLPIIIWTQHVAPTTSLPENCVMSPAMTWPALLCKVIWALNLDQGPLSPKKLQQLLATDVAGELRGGQTI